MANYPDALPMLATNKSDDTVMAGDHAVNHNSANDEINAIGAELGITPSGASATVTTRLDALDAVVAATGTRFDQTVDTVAADVLSSPAGTTENAFVVKAPAATWGDGTPYGTAQAFMLLREDYDDTEGEPDENVLFRVSGRDGGLGTAGGIHVAYGLRQHTGWAPSGTGAVWIENRADAHNLVLSEHSAQTLASLVINRAGSGEANNRVEITGGANGGAILANRGIRVGSPSATTAAQLYVGVQGALWGIFAGIANAGEVLPTTVNANVVLAGPDPGNLRIGNTGRAALSIGAGFTVFESNDLATVAAAGWRRGGSGGAESVAVVEGVAGGWTAGTAVGDFVLRHLATARRMWIGLGAAANEIQIDDGEIAFLGAAPVARQSVGAAATDAATTQTLANNLRTALVNLGLCQT
ncbi:MAG: hypothetical protein ACRDNE_00680 [Gaiellaceae bacterium]